MRRPTHPQARRARRSESPSTGSAPSCRSYSPVTDRAPTRSCRLMTIWSGVPASMARSADCCEARRISAINARPLSPSERRAELLGHGVHLEVHATLADERLQHPLAFLRARIGDLDPILEARQARLRRSSWDSWSPPARTRVPSVFLTPSICVSSSLTISMVYWSPRPPLRDAAVDSISSMKSTVGLDRARSNSSLTSFPDSPDARP